MTFRLRKPSISYRATVVQECRLVLTPEEDAAGNPHAIRRVRVITPGGTRVFGCIDPSPADIDTNQGPMVWSELPQDWPFEFYLKPEQSFGLCCEIALAQTSVFIEYLDVE